MDLVRVLDEAIKNSIGSALENIERDFKWNEYTKKFSFVYYDVLGDDGKVSEEKVKEEIEFTHEPNFNISPPTSPIIFKDTRSLYRFMQAGMGGTAGTGIDPYALKKIQIYGDNRLNLLEKTYGKSVRAKLLQLVRTPLET